MSSYMFLGAKGKSVRLDEPVPFEIVEVPISDEAAEGGFGRLFRFEVLYQGAGGDVLRLLYREYTNSMVRPAFTQELTYDVPNDGSFTITARGAKLEILEASNEGITYRVLRGFDK